MPMNQRMVVIGVTLTTAMLMMLGVAAAAPAEPSSSIRPPQPGPACLERPSLTLAYHQRRGITTDTLTLTFAGNVWPVSLPVTQAQLSPDAGATFNVSVTIPLTPATTRDTVTVTVTGKQRAGVDVSVDDPVLSHLPAAMQVPPKAASLRAKAMA